MPCGAPGSECQAPAGTSLGAGFVVLPWPVDREPRPPPPGVQEQMRTSVMEKLQLDLLLLRTLYTSRPPEGHG